jgi:transaldolase
VWPRPARDNRAGQITTEDGAGRRTVKATETLHERGQSLWLDNITRSLLDDGTIQRYIDSYSVTGLTSNPSLFDKAIGSGDYDEAIRSKAGQARPAEELFFKLAIEDLQRAADLFLPIHERTDGVDGWVSLEVSPLLAYDTARTVAAVKALHARAERSNLFIKIPGTPEGLPAITEAIAAGIPVNVTLLFSAGHYLAAADAYLNGVERRIASGLDPAVGSVASVFMSRWDTAVSTQVPADLADKLALAVGLDIYRAYRQLMSSDRFQRLENEGARMQRLLWASTSTKDPAAPDTLYVHGLAAPFTVNTMPDNTLEAFFDHGEVGDPLPADGGDANVMLGRFTQAGVDLGDVAAQLQRNGATSFVDAWNELLDRIRAQASAIT